MKPDGELPMENSPTDGKSWSDTVGSDTDAKVQSFKFAVEPTKRVADESIEAKDFALIGDDIKGVGADPSKVGPRSAVIETSEPSKATPDEAPKKAETTEKKTADATKKKGKTV